MGCVNCDSQYKFFGPHMGVLYGKYDLLDRLHAYKVRPAPGDPPGKYETGTQNHSDVVCPRGSRGHWQR
jgi:selenocysteine lyase/cysteine desulfurase